MYIIYIYIYVECIYIYIYIYLYERIKSYQYKCVCIHACSSRKQIHVLETLKTNIILKSAIKRAELLVTRSIIQQWDVDLLLNV